MTLRPGEVRALAASRGYLLEKGKGRVVGKHDFGKYGLKHARSGVPAFGFGNRGVTATLAEVANFLAGKEK